MDDAASEALRPHLLAGTTGLEHLWQEASSHLADSEPGTERWQRWNEALSIVTQALTETELVTGGSGTDHRRHDRWAQGADSDRTSA